MTELKKIQIGLAAVLVALFTLLAAQPATAAEGIPGEKMGVAFSFGLNDQAQTELPARPAASLWTAFSGGGSHSLALLENGQVQGFGNDDDGRIDIPGLPAGETYTAISAGQDHSLLLTSAGKIKAIGGNSYGQLNVPDLTNGLRYTGISAGGSFSLAVVSDGTLRAWGWSNFNKTTVPSPPTGARFTQVAAGYNHAIALLDTGKVATWGRNLETQQLIPVPLQGTSYVEVDASGNRTLALRSDGQVFGAGETIDGAKAPPVAPGFEKYVDIAVGDDFGLAVTDKGTVKSFGMNDHGQLDVPYIQPSLQATSIDAGADHTIAILARKPTVVLEGSSDAIAHGDPYSATVKVTTGNGTPTGKVTLKRSGTPVSTDSLSSGQRIFRLSPGQLGIGNNFLYAEYAGDRRTVAGLATATKVIVSKAQPSVYLVLPNRDVTTSATPNLTVRVEAGSASLTGEIKVHAGGRLIETRELKSSDSGEVTLTLPRFARSGDYPITAEYGGSETAEAATGTAPLKVTGTKPTMTLKAPKKASASKRVKLTARIKAGALPATGRLTFFDGKRKLRSVKMGARARGKLTVKLPRLKRRGTHNIRVEYGGSPAVAGIEKRVKITII